MKQAVIEPSEIENSRFEQFGDIVDNKEVYGVSLELDYINDEFQLSVEGNTKLQYIKLRLAKKEDMSQEIKLKIMQ